MAIFERPISISFGDCDPAGIVYYPNYFRWMDGTFHALLQERGGGHRNVCAELNARGTGLMEAKLEFRSPASEGMVIVYSIDEISWAGRSFDISYSARHGDRLILEGHERRGLFVEKDDRLRASAVSPLRAILNL